MPQAMRLMPGRWCLMRWHVWVPAVCSRAASRDTRSEGLSTCQYRTTRMLPPKRASADAPTAHTSWVHAESSSLHVCRRDNNSPCQQTRPVRAAVRRHTMRPDRPGCGRCAESTVTPFFAHSRASQPQHEASFGGEARGCHAPCSPCYAAEWRFVRSFFHDPLPTKSDPRPRPRGRQSRQLRSCGVSGRLHRLPATSARRLRGGQSAPRGVLSVHGHRARECVRCHRCGWGR